MAICRDCVHLRRGHASLCPEQQERSWYRTDMICAARPIVPGRVDPLTGRKAPDIGAGCEHINTEGQCADFVPAGWLTRMWRR